MAWRIGAHVLLLDRVEPQAGLLRGGVVPLAVLLGVGGHPLVVVGVASLGGVDPLLLGTNAGSAHSPCTTKQHLPDRDGILISTTSTTTTTTTRATLVSMERSINLNGRSGKRICAAWLKSHQS